VVEGREKVASEFEEDTIFGENGSLLFFLNVWSMRDAMAAGGGGDLARGSGFPVRRLTMREGRLLGCSDTG